MSVWSWIVLIAALAVAAEMSRALGRELVSEAAFRWYARHSRDRARKPWYVLAYERRQARRKGPGG